METKIERKWAMPNRWTFTIKPIREMLADEVEGYWCDPFAGKNSPAQITNDLIEEALFNMDALEFLKTRADGEFDGVLFDPPYSFRQASECYKLKGLAAAKVTSKKYWAECKNEIARIIKPGGKAICFGWNTNGMGINRGFSLHRALIIPHGGSMNDTLITIEIKK